MTRRGWRSPVTMPLLLTMLLGQPARVGAAGPAATAANDDAAAPNGDGVKAPAYVDRLIAGLAPLPVASEEGAGGVTSGRPRSLTIEDSLTRLAPSLSRHVAGSTDEAQTEAGVIVTGRYDTGNYGVLGLDGTLRYGNSVAPFGSSIGGGTQRSVVGGVLTLSDTGLPIGHGWTADSAIGVVDPRFIRLARVQSQLYLPNQPVLGLDISLASLRGAGRNATDASSSFNLSIGEPGLPGGLRLAQFRGLGGVEASAGGEIRPAAGFAIGLQAIATNHVRDPYSVVFGDLAGAGRINGEAVLLAASAGAADWRIQANLLHSRTERAGSLPGHNDQPALVPGLDRSNVGPGSATGGWVDALLDRGRVTQRAGVFYLDPRLAWGATPTINDAYGGYYRVTMADARWRGYAGIDVNRTISGAGLDSESLDLGVRRQLNGIAIGGEAALRVLSLSRRDATVHHGAGSDMGKQLNGYVEIGSPFGLTRLEASYGFDRIEDLAHLSVTQTWTLPASLPASTRLSTQLFYDMRHDRIVGVDGGTTRADGFGVAVTAGGDVLGKVSVDASLAYGGSSEDTDGISPGGAGLGGFGGIGNVGSSSQQHGRNFSATLAANARLSSRWTVNGSFTSSETSLRQAFGFYGIDGALPGLLAAADPASRDRFRLLSATFAIRYSLAAGRASSPIGRQTFAGRGAGVISGHIYLDANSNGQRDPGEAGVRDAVVVLDGVTAVRTDAAGYYRLDDVSEGQHEISVQSDALPLPWHYVPDGQMAPISSDSGVHIAIIISVRKTSTVDICATR